MRSQAEADDPVQETGRAGRLWRAHHADDVSGDLDRCQNQPKWEAPPTEEQADREIAQLTFHTARSAANARAAAPGSKVHRGPDTVRGVYVDRAGPLAFWAGALMHLVDLLFENFDRHLVGYREEDAVLVAFPIAEAEVAVADAAEKNRGSAVITFGHWW